MALTLVLSGASFVSESNDNGCADPDVDNSALTACGDVDSQTTAAQPVGRLIALFYLLASTVLSVLICLLCLRCLHGRLESLKMLLWLVLTI